MLVTTEAPPERMPGILSPNVPTMARDDGRPLMFAKIRRQIRQASISSIGGKDQLNAVNSGMANAGRIGFVHMT